MTKQEAKERITLVHCWTDINNNPTVNSYECSLYMNNDGLCEDCEYHIALECIEKQIPKNAELETSEGEYAIFLCPNCHEIFHNYIDEPHYCEHCGQAIDWESDNE